MSSLLTWIETGPKVSVPVLGILKTAFHLTCVLICKLHHGLFSAVANRPPQVAGMACEVVKRRFGAIFLALKKHGSTWAEQPKGRHRTIPGRARQQSHMNGAAKVSHLIMVFQKCNKSFGW